MAFLPPQALQMDNIPALLMPSFKHLRLVPCELRGRLFGFQIRISPRYRNFKGLGKVLEFLANSISNQKKP